MKPFRFGVSLWEGRSRAEVTEKARRIESLGYDLMTVPDHLTRLLAPLPVLVSAAAATQRLRLGTNVLNNDFRHPVVLAREAATVDLLTDGRFQLGLGAGSIEAEYREAGLPFDPGGTRVARLGEAVAIVKRLLSGERLIFAGQHYRVSEHVLDPLPVQRPHPPILIGGNGRKLLALAAREADIIGFSGITFRGGGALPPDLSAWRVAALEARLRHVRESAGEDRFARLELNALVQRVVVTDDRRRAAEELTQRWTQLSVDELLQSPFALIGTTDEIAHDLETRRARWGFSSYVVQEPYLDTFAPIVARLAGR
jgi:probable F420-dependent oxidoreductase